MPFTYVFPFYFESDPLVRVVDVTVRIAFGDDMFDETPTWSDVSADALEVHTLRGRKHELDRMEAGTCTIILDNASGDYYPDNTGGTYYPDVKIMQRVNVRAAYDGAPVVDVFTGYVESWSPDWLSKSGKGPIVKVVCSDALKIFARTLLNNAGEAAELSGTRVGNVADEVNWPAGWRDIDTGQETLQATGAQANVNALDHLQKAQESELSLVYIAPDNDLQFEDRSHRTNTPHDAAELFFGDGGEDDGEDRYSGIKFVMDESLLFNDVRMTRTGGAEQTSSNATSQTAYGIRSIARSGLLNNSDVAVELLTDYFVARYAESVSRVKSIEIQPARNPGSLWYKVLNYDISTRINITLDQASIDKDYFIEGVAHDWIASKNDFRTRWQLSDASQELNPPDAKDETLRPTGAGTYTELTIAGGTPAATNWQSVDEVIADDDVTIVESETCAPIIYQYDSYGTANSSYAAGTINSVTIYCRVVCNGAPSVVPKAKTHVYTHTTQYFGDEVELTNGVWENISKVYALNPNTSAAWTWTEVNAMEIGVALKGGIEVGFYNSDAQCTQCWAIVNFTPGW